MNVNTFPLKNVILYLLVAFLIQGCLVIRAKEMKYEKEEVLDLSRKRLSEIPPYAFEQTQLKSLRLFNNQITEIPPEIANLENLEELYLASNQLVSLPKEITQLKKLRILTIS